MPDDIPQLPEVKENRKYINRVRNLKKRKREKLEKEWKGRPQKKAAKKAVEPKKKVRKAKTVVANEKVGKETLKKKNASALLAEKKQKLRAQRSAAKSSKDTAKVEQEHSDEGQPIVKQEMDHLSPEEMDKKLIERTVFGQDESFQDDQFQGLSGDANLYPSEDYLSDYAQKKKAELVTEEELLGKAHEYFTDLNKREKELKKAAVKYIQRLTEINRRGGDKDGFKYVIPRSTKSVVRRMLASQGGDYVDPDSLVSTFGGEEVTQEETEDKSDYPTRKRKRNPDRYKDFYQFQVTKRWTENAEKFLKRGRAHKALFEAKKHQRSIRKL